MTKIIHVVGNGFSAESYDPKAPGMTLTCNLPPFAIPHAAATCMVDFKMMKAIEEGSVVVPGNWVLGFRPKKYTEMRSSFYLKHAPQIKDFYTVLPKYAKTYTDFNCGHFAVHYAANKLKGNEIHMYGFDSMFEFDLRSCTDFYLQSNRENTHTEKLTSNWRPLWENIFKEFPDTKFFIYYKHNHIKISIPDNVELIIK